MRKQLTQGKTGRIRNSLSIASFLVFVILATNINEVVAQTMMPIGPHVRVYTGSIRGYWFTAPADFFILGVRVPTDANSNAQDIHLMRLPSPPPAYAASTTNYTTLGYWSNQTGTAMIPVNPPILVQTGDIIGILGARRSGTRHANSYGNSLVSSNVFGQPMTLTRFLYQGTIQNGPAGPVSEESSGPISRVEIYYGPPCEVPDPNTNLQVSVTDAGGNPIGYTEIPSTVYAKYRIAYPDTASPVTVTLNFFRVGGSTTTPEFSVTVNDHKLEGQVLTNTQAISIPSGVQAGYYRVIPVVNSFNSCHEPQDTELNEFTIMLVDPGAVPCIVWPGDVNADLLVNYADKKGLNNYIHEANLRSTWLSGPTRYRSELASNPLALLDWVPQAAVPWFTPEGCHMDTDGNGIINSFDNIAIRKNWMRVGTEATKDAQSYSVETYSMSQNFPNPFNPSTRIEYNVPEPSHVKITVTDMLGREVTTLVDEMRPVGASVVTFDAANLESGNYIAIATMQGTTTGTSYTKSIRMTLSK